MIIGDSYLAFQGFSITLPLITICKQEATWNLLVMQNLRYCLLLPPLNHTLHFKWATLVDQTVKNSPAMEKTWVQSLGWKDPLEKGMATHSSILTWRIPMDRGA